MWWRARVLFAVLGLCVFWRCLTVWETRKRSSREDLLEERDNIEAGPGGGTQHFQRRGQEFISTGGALQLLTEDFKSYWWLSLPNIHSDILTESNILSASVHSICGITHNIQICQKTELNAHCSTFKQNLSLFPEALFISSGTSDPEVECYEMKTSFLLMLAPQ